jgi:hypothetical protein
MTDKLKGSAACPLCGRDTPHSHEPREVEVERYCRPAFEKHFHHWMYLFLHPGSLLHGSLRIKHWSNKPAWSLRASEMTRMRTGHDYEDPTVEAFWKLWLLAWGGKPSWCTAFDSIANREMADNRPH